MIASLVELTIKRDFKKLSEKSTALISSLIASLVGGASVAMSTILTDSLVVNRQASELLRWPLAAVVALVLFVKFSSSIILNRDDATDENLYLARVVSPGLATTLFFGTLLLVYVWTNQFSSALIGSLVISAPYFLLFLVFPKIGKVLKSEVPRNILLEAFIVAALTWGIYILIQLLPMAVVSKSRAFILLGLVPSLLHAIYSVAVASSEFQARRTDLEEMA
jgi:hypothetical protein